MTLSVRIFLRSAGDVRDRMLAMAAKQPAINTAHVKYPDQQLQR